jgi:molybdate transport system substrate-binding protein
MKAPGLKLVSSMATRDVLAALIADYAQISGQNVSAEAAGGVDVAKRVQAGEPVDVVVLASTAIDKLIADARLLAGSRVDLIRSGIGVAVRSGAPEPPMTDEQAVRDLVLAADSLSYSTGPSGVYLESLFARWGILEELRARIVVPPPGKPVGSLVAEGFVALGFQQLSELLPLAGITVLGPLPPAIQHLTVFSGGIAQVSERPTDARAVLAFLASPAAAAVKERYGMEHIAS